jgi:hypothetical protein
MHILSTNTPISVSPSVSLSVEAKSSVSASASTSGQPAPSSTTGQTASGVTPQYVSAKGTKLLGTIPEAGATPASKAASTATSATTSNLDSQLAQITRLLPQQQLLEAKLLKSGQLIQLPLPGATALLTGQSTENNQLNLLLRKAAGLLRTVAPQGPDSTNLQNRLQSLLPNSATHSSSTNTSQAFLNKPSEGPKLIQLGQLVAVAKTKSGFQLESSNNGVNQHLIRLLLPSDKPLNRSLSDLAALAQQGLPKSITHNLATPAGGSTLASILKLIPQSQDISPEVIRQTVNHAGLSADTLRGTSLGTLLLTLIKQLQPGADLAQATAQSTAQSTTATSQPASTESITNASTMRQLATDALAKIIFSQLRPLLEATNDGLESRRLDFLVKHEDQFSLFDLGINKQVPPPEQEETRSHADSDKQKARRWDVRLNFNLAQLGQITANINFTEGISLDLTFWAERPQTFELLNHHAKGFKENLGDSLTLIAGQQTTEDEENRFRQPKSGNPRISISLAVINEAHPEPKISLSSQLVDVNA